MDLPLEPRFLCVCRSLVVHPSDVGHDRRRLRGGDRARAGTGRGDSACRARSFPGRQSGPSRVLQVRRTAFPDRRGSPGSRCGRRRHGEVVRRHPAGGHKLLHVSDAIVRHRRLARRRPRPYHPAAWSVLRNQAGFSAGLEATARLLRHLSGGNGALFFDFSDPASVPCPEQEFFDGDHPNEACLRRLFARFSLGPAGDDRRAGSPASRPTR